MKNVHVVTKEILTRVSKVNFLVMTPGYVTTKGWEETEDGVDKKLALHYYSRWKFISDFLPALKRAKEAGEDAKVLSVLAAAKGGVIDVNDIGLRKTFSFIKARRQIPTYNDLMMEVSKPSFPFHYFRYPTALYLGICHPKSRSRIRPRLPRTRPNIHNVLFRLAHHSSSLVRCHGARIRIWRLLIIPGEWGIHALWLAQRHTGRLSDRAKGRGSWNEKVLGIGGGEKEALGAYSNSG
jgi:hypothetical protein